MHGRAVLGPHLGKPPVVCRRTGRQVTSTHDVYYLDISDVSVDCLILRISHSEQDATLEAVVAASIAGSERII